MYWVYYYTARFSISFSVPTTFPPETLLRPLSTVLDKLQPRRNAENPHHRKVIIVSLKNHLYSLDTFLVYFFLSADNFSTY